jgi:hypothetical protein
MLKQQQQQQQQEALDSLSEALKAAQSKVEAATSPGAFGHGVPDLHNIATQELLMAFGVTAIGGILIYALINLISHREGIERDQLLATASTN